MLIFINGLLDFPSKEWIPRDLEDFRVRIEDLLDQLNAFNFLNEAEIYYSGIEFEFLAGHFNELEKLSEFSLTNPIDQIRELLFELAATNWEESMIQKNDHLYFLITDLGATTYPIVKSSLIEASENKNLGRKVELIHFPQSFFDSMPKIVILKSNTNPPNDHNLLEFSSLKDLQSTLNFYFLNRKEITYNWNKKHGENGEGMISNKGEEVSPLLGTREEAAELLKVSISYSKSSELYALDKLKDNKIMVFKRDSKDEKSYHSYHPINQSEVNPDVIKFLNKIKR